MSELVSAQGFSLTGKVWQVCNGWLMDGERVDGSAALLYVEPKTRNPAGAGKCELQKQFANLNAADALAYPVD